MAGSNSSYFVYLLLCSDNSLYTGITPNLQRRMRQHTGQLKGGARYTALRPPKEIAAVWIAPDKATAAKAEYAIKHLSAENKRRLAAQPDQIHEILARQEPLPLISTETPSLQQIIHP